MPKAVVSQLGVRLRALKITRLRVSSRLYENKGQQLTSRAHDHQVTFPVGFVRRLRCLPTPSTRCASTSRSSGSSRSLSTWCTRTCLAQPRQSEHRTQNTPFQIMRARARRPTSVSCPVSDTGAPDQGRTGRRSRDCCARGHAVSSRSSA